MIINGLDDKLREVVAGLNQAETVRREKYGYGYSESVHKWHLRPGRKYYKINVGTSGAFLVEKETGELFNIKAYGVADRNKKRKADIGNIFTVDPTELHSRRYNYLR